MTGIHGADLLSEADGPRRDDGGVEVFGLFLNGVSSPAP